MKTIRKTCLWGALTALLLAILLALCSCDVTLSVTVPTEAQTTAASMPEFQDPEGESEGVPTTPADTVAPSDETEPADTTDTEPGDTHSDETEPIDPKPSDTEPSDSQPTETHPAEECQHTPVPIPAVNPTCTEDGHTEGSVCDGCGAILDQPDELPAAGHTYTLENECKCVACGEQALCPVPLLSETGERSVPWGETLTLTWHPAEDPLFSVVYMVMADGQTSLWDAWSEDTAFTRTFTEDGETVTLWVAACYALHGVPISATQSASAQLTLLVETREALEPPVFLWGNEITVDPRKDVTVAWGPVTAEGAEPV